MKSKFALVKKDISAGEGCNFNMLMGKFNISYHFLSMWFGTGCSWLCKSLVKYRDAGLCARLSDSSCPSVQFHSTRHECSSYINWDHRHCKTCFNQVKLISITHSDCKFNEWLMVISVERYRFKRDATKAHTFLSLEKYSAKVSVNIYQPNKGRI